jgi:SpoIIAA-like
MSLKVEVLEEDEYVCLRCSGSLTIDELKKLYSQAIDAALEHKRSDILIDGREVTGDLSTFERYESSEFLAKEIRQRALGKIRKIAVCAKEPPVDPKRFGETIAVNRGINAKVTTDLNEAIAWLLQK